MLSVCAWVCSPIIIVDEWVVSSYFGRRPINVSRLQKNKININNVCLVEQEGNR